MDMAEHLLFEVGKNKYLYKKGVNSRKAIIRIDGLVGPKLLV